MSEPTQLKELPKVTVNYRAVVYVGTAAWVIALVTLLIVGAVTDASVTMWIWVCVTGVALGILARLYLMLPGTQATRT